MSGFGREPVSTPDGWGVRWEPSPAARIRLFCLPHSGGGAAAYRRWAGLLAPDIEVVALRPPGRESRFHEPPFTRLDDLVASLVRGVEPLLERPHAWFGHSMGAPVAFEVCRALRRLGAGEPIRLFTSAYPAPHLVPRWAPVHDASPEEFLRRLRRFGGTPPELLARADALTGFLPTLRADFAVVETYRCRPEPALECPLSVFGGTEDTFTDVTQLREWRLHSTEECLVRMVPGGHFFPHADPARVLDAIRADLPAPSRALW